VQFKKARFPRSKNIPAKYLIPNAITLLALGSGLTSIRMAYEQRFELTIFAILFAAVLDGIDGRAARLLNASSKFGAELDSLADFVNFGVAPALIVYFWSLKEFKSLGWIVALTYAICICLRLARFNVETEEENLSPWKKKFFQGSPAPASAALLLMPFYTRFLSFEIVIPSFLIIAYTIAISLLAASSIPTFSFKDMGSIPRQSVRAGLVVIILVASLMATYTWESFIMGGFIYLLTIPFSIMKYAKYERNEIKLSEDEQLNLAEQEFE
jgi:CDP-diacylglycerol---serine O-phosphatidyltransferase